jgi:16S rRNA (cytidine1402-2'-O)-methyltransferase
VTALILSDLPAHSFIFKGFPPHKSGPRKCFFSQDKDSPITQIYYESPYRLQVFLKDALEILGNRKIVIANDLTKKFETLYRGNIEEMIEKFSSETIRGEYTIVIEGKPED